MPWHILDLKGRITYEMSMIGLASTIGAVLTLGYVQTDDLRTGAW
jgi:hypothetical protein